jgi:virulence factor Mce-like protein
MSSRRPASRQRHGPVSQLVIAGLLVTASAFVIYVSLTAENAGIPTASPYNLKVQFADLANLRKNDDVRIAGRRVGQVLRPRVERGRSVVDVQLESDVGHLPADTTAIVRAKGLLGARYLELQPGNSRATLRDGATIPSSHTSATLQLADVINTFDARTREHVGQFLRGAGLGFAGRGGQLNVMLDKLPQVLGDTQAVATAVISRSGAAARFAPSLDSAVRAFDPVRRELAQGLAPQEHGLRPFARSQAAIRDLLQAAPDALAGTRSGLAESAPVLDEAAAFARATTRTLRDAPAALAQTRALLVESHRPLRRAAPLLDRLRAAVPPVLVLVRRLEAVSDPLRRGLVATIPTLRELTAHACDVKGFASNWRSMLEWGVPGGGGVGPLNLFRYTVTTTPESLQRSGASLNIGVNAYPAPCEAGTEVLK